MSISVEILPVKNLYLIFLNHLIDLLVGKTHAETGKYWTLVDTIAVNSRICRVADDRPTAELAFYLASSKR